MLLAVETNDKRNYNVRSGWTGQSIRLGLGKVLYIQCGSYLKVNFLLSI